MAKKSKSLPDDRTDRRSVIVPNDLWRYIECAAHKTDKSEAAVIRDLIKFALNAHESIQTYRRIEGRFELLFQQLHRLSATIPDAKLHLRDIIRLAHEYSHMNETELLTTIEPFLNAIAELDDDQHS